MTDRPCPWSAEELGRLYPQFPIAVLARMAKTNDVQMRAWLVAAGLEIRKPQGNPEWRRGQLVRGMR